VKRKPLVLTPELVAHVERKVPQDHLPPDPGRVPMSDDDYAAAVSEMIAARPDGPAYVFAYGSLLWNPGIDVVERRPAWLRGWHRAFCMKLHRFRGSPEQPGLMLALEQGGSCKGEVFRLPDDSIAGQFDKLMRREVPNKRNARAWRWVDVTIAGEKRKALTFYAGMRRDSHYVRMPLREQAHMLARAAGHGGSGAAYLHQTVMKLEEAGIHDTYLWELQHMVAAEIRAMFPDPAERPQAAHSVPKP
jgi:glutathione-specific gamma-glutamylcyclotransferase